jgi:hypothetical protein
MAGTKPNAKLVWSETDKLRIRAGWAYWSPRPSKSASRQDIIQGFYPGQRKG